MTQQTWSKITVLHRYCLFTLVISEIAYTPEEPGRLPTLNDPGEPPVPESFEVLDGFVWLECEECSHTMLYTVNKMLFNSMRLFWILVDKHMDIIIKQIKERGL